MGEQGDFRPKDSYEVKYYHQKVGLLKIILKELKYTKRKGYVEFLKAHLL